MTLSLKKYTDFHSNRGVHLGVNKFAAFQWHLSSHCHYVTHQWSRWKWVIHSESVFLVLIHLSCFLWSFIFHCQGGKKGQLYLNWRMSLCWIYKCVSLCCKMLQIVVRGRCSLCFHLGKNGKWNTSSSPSHTPTRRGGKQFPSTLLGFGGDPHNKRH